MKKHFLIFVIILCAISNLAQTEDNLHKTLYIYRPLINGDDLQNWAQEQGLEIISADSLHVTLAYSRGGLKDGVEVMDSDSNYLYNSDPDHVRQLGLFGKEKSVLVLKLNAPELVERWEALILAGAKWDWPVFEPHVTLTYDAQEIDLEQISPYYGDLVFGPEVHVEFENQR